ncbi:hypothetical protein [Blastococcus montanus]|uniref:hypothetical protein n=1 Tax=Blastococcus montanus TaxID=3144973 RepID=UPI00387E96F6
MSQFKQENEMLPGGLLSARRAPRMMYPLVQELAADKIPVVVTCPVLGFSKQALYTREPSPPSSRAVLCRCRRERTA